MKSVIYAVLTTFRGLVFFLCKLLSFLFILGAIFGGVMGGISDRPFPWAPFLLSIAFAVFFQSILIFYNRIVIWASNGTVIVSE
ncbi:MULTISPECIES: hypothetical protein [Thalassospira]|uniref:ABC transporter permease n=1 Tax=Thalassospira indica TaxID=1891279 RepID=A0ABN5NDQ3_9PROT|nr:hypothetical protein [Thalassospira indica]AXO14566.1 hypothetical protein DY252_10325 [Thalassospira indica]OAZ10000.1 hypothetical protein TH15_19485 [Thalassospira profundimaris]